MPSSDLEPVTITDYLPLPVLLASEVSGPFVATVSAAVPAAGFSVEKRATMPRGVPLGLAPYNAVLLRKKAA